MKLHFLGMFFLLSTFFVFSCYGDDNLDAGYAKLLALSMTDDISVATLHSDGFRYQKYSLPYEFKDLYVTGDYFFSMHVRTNYLKIKSPRLHIDTLNSLKSRWDIFSFTLSPKITYKINAKLSLEHELGLGYANMRNSSSFHGDGKVHAALRDEGLADWNVNSFYVTPKIGLRNKNKLTNDDELNFYGRLSYLFINGFKHEEKLNVNSNTGTWSLGSEYVMTNLFNVNKRSVNLILANDIGGFYGKKYRELSFGFINNTSLAIEAPINLYNNELKMKAGIGYLISDNAHGVTVTLEVK